MAQKNDKIANDRLLRPNPRPARDLFIAEGYQSVSIRKIAERIEYSPAAIYSYYASKDDHLPRTRRRRVSSAR